MNAVTCKNCGKELSEEMARTEPRIPCPECGDMARIISATATTKLELSDHVSASLVSGHTGREVTVMQVQVEIDEWAGLQSRDALLAHPAAERFRISIATATCLSGDSLTVFRGQGIRDGEEQPPSIGRMGPLPLHLEPGGGRYHRAGERVLYLTDSEQGAWREMAAWSTQGTPWVLRSEIPLESLRIANFSDLSPDDFVTAVFSKAECCMVSGRGPADYLFSQAIGELVAARFDGMQIPGVRGERGAHYRNIVLFRSFSDWPRWNHATPYILVATDAADSGGRPDDGWPGGAEPPGSNRNLWQYK